MNELDLTRSLVRKVLEHPLGHDWSVQGLGMLRLYLTPEVRLHVWEPSLAEPHVWNSSVHDHPWDFKSTILCGQITNTVYDTTSTGEPFNRQSIVCGPGGCAEGQPEKVHLSIVSCLTYQAGSYYMQSAPEVHRSSAAPGTTTIVERFFVKADRTRALVFWKGDRWVSAEPRKATPAETTRACEAALQLLG